MSWGCNEVSLQVGRQVILRSLQAYSVAVGEEKNRIAASYRIEVDCMCVQGQELNNA